MRRGIRSSGCRWSFLFCFSDGAQDTDRQAKTKQQWETEVERQTNINKSNFFFFLSLVNYAITNYEKCYKTILQPAILPALWGFTPGCIILSHLMRSMPDGTFCAMPKISCMFFSINLHNSPLLGFETQTSWCRSINEPLLKPLDQGGFHKISSLARPVKPFQSYSLSITTTSVSLSSFNDLIWRS